MDRDWKADYLELLQIMRIHDSHSHSAVVRYVEDHMGELRRAREYASAVHALVGKLHEIREKSRGFM